MPSLPYPIFAWEPDFSDAPRYALSTFPAVLDLSRARRIVGFPHEKPERLFRFAFRVGEGIGRAILEFYRDRGGPVRPFFLPSWSRDLTPRQGVAIGQTSIVVDYVDYNTAHLATTTEDHYGRYVYLWTPGQPVFVDRVIRATASGVTSDTLDLDSSLPWAASQDRLLIGFAHIVRFDEETMSLRYSSAIHAEVDIVFRSSRMVVTV